VPFSFSVDTCASTYPVSYEFDPSNDSSTTFDTSNLSSMFFKTLTTDKTKIGQHTINLKIQLSNYPLNSIITTKKSFILTITSICELAKLSIPTPYSTNYFMNGVETTVELGGVPPSTTPIKAQDPNDPLNFLDYNLCGAY